MFRGSYKIIIPEICETDQLIFAKNTQKINFIFDFLNNTFKQQLKICITILP